MSEIVTTELVKELRDTTGISVMQCKRALEEAEGDMKKALAILKKTSSEIALKKADRIAKDGAVMIKTNKGKAVLVALHCETDFVAKNEDFVKLLENLTNKIFDSGIEKTKEEINNIINPVIQKTGENIVLGDVYEVLGDVLGSYVHNNKSAVIVSLKGGDEALAKEIAMHIVAMKPEYIKREEIDEETLKTITEVFEKEVIKINKEDSIKKKILDGKIATYFKEKTLLDQPFIKDGELTIEKLLDNAKAEIIEVKCYSI
ncbi:MAG: translation elongation factor Ts [Patescibacteria group bacterium]